MDGQTNSIRRFADGEILDGLRGNGRFFQQNRSYLCRTYLNRNRFVDSPRDAVPKIKKTDSTTGRSVDTDFDKFIGFNVFADVCPSAGIKMGLGE